MSEKLSEEPKLFEIESLRVIHLDSYMLESPERKLNDIEDSYISIRDMRNHRHLIAPWLNNLEDLPEKIIIDCQQTGFSVELDTNQLIKSSFNSRALHDTETGSTATLVVLREERAKLKRLSQKKTG